MYSIIAKKSDYTESDLIDKLQNYCFPAHYEELNECGDWEICSLEEIKIFLYNHGLEYLCACLIMIDVIGDGGYRLGDDGKFYKKVGTKYSEFDIKDTMTHAQAKEICSQNNDKLTGFIENSKLYFTEYAYEKQGDYSLYLSKDEIKNCPFADNEEVYFIECYPKDY